MYMNILVLSAVTGCLVLTLEWKNQIYISIIAYLGFIEKYNLSPKDWQSTGAVAFRLAFYIFGKDEDNDTQITLPMLSRFCGGGCPIERLTYISVQMLKDNDFMPCQKELHGSMVPFSLKSKARYDDSSDLSNFMNKLVTGKRRTSI